ncbi:MAG: hypothetical protein HYR66_08635 [Sphingobacteriales bacterium]|nr:hypothetical protein [Sphingobacteriales bacterium]MBI3720030.1 hypothetical protein [Sphingobacteriales bacterium]
MKSFLIILLFISCCTFSRANTSWPYKYQKDGITFYATGSADSVEMNKLFKTFFNKLVNNLKRADKSYEIFLITDRFLIFPFFYDKWFGSIAWDTLRKPDNAFLFDYYYYRVGGENAKWHFRKGKPASTKYLFDLPEPIDIGSTYDTSKAKVGLKIIYNYAAEDSLTVWDRLFTLVQYGIDHIEEIKQTQKRISVPLPMMTYEPPNIDKQVSLLTIDTGLIRTLPLLKLEFDAKKAISQKAISPLIYTTPILAIMFIFGLLLIIKNRKTIYKK